jgi:hypothetical protein
LLDAANNPKAPCNGKCGRYGGIALPIELKTQD